MKPIKTNNVTELYMHLASIFDDLGNGTVDPKRAVEVNNTAGKIFMGLKVQLAYHALRSEEPEIPFIAGTTSVTSRVRDHDRIAPPKPAK